MIMYRKLNHPLWGKTKGIRMFLGSWLHSHVEGFIPRSCPKKGKWNHWKIVVTRERFSDCALRRVEIKFFEARKLRNCWSFRRTCSFKHLVDLGNSHDPGFDERLVTPHEC